MSSLVVDSLPNQNKQLCRAWVNFDGTGVPTIRDSYNVASITDNGVGDYIINFSQAMANTNFSWAGSVGGIDESHTGNPIVLELDSARNVNNLRVETSYTSSSQNSIDFDASMVSVQVFSS